MCGSNGAAPGRAQSTGAELANCGNCAGGRKLDVVRNDAVWSWLPAEPAALSAPANPLNAPAVPASGNGVAVRVGAAVVDVGVRAQPVLHGSRSAAAGRRVASASVHSGWARSGW